MRLLLGPLACVIAASGTAQLTVWAEEFENGCTQNCLASGYIGVGGAWSVQFTGPNGPCGNRWFISCQENGNPAGTCGGGCGNNETLHVGNDGTTCTSPNGCFFCPSGDCGAAYDASCPPGICAVCCSCQSSRTDARAESPAIDLSGWSTLTLRFKYMEGGAGTTDNALLDYFDGTVWSQLADLPKSPVGTCGTQGLWTNYSIALPASANNNPNVRIGFRWVNDDDGAGGDPSVAIDDVEILAPYTPPGTGLVVNELSNGPTGNKEYIELAVVGPGCTADIRGMKVDDNNGVANNGFGNLMNGSGVSIGHIRFNPASAQWATVPVGSLILIYNGTDLNALVPPADLDDTAPNDSIYILPATSTLLQGCGNFPDGLVTATYPNCTFGGASWTWIGLRDQGDAGQTRDPQGRYFHGISYGPNLQNMNNGGLDNLRITTAGGAASVLWFNGGNFRQAASFSAGPVVGNETPGAANNASNRAWLKGIRCSVLPVELLYFTASAGAGGVRLAWATATEQSSDHFVVDRSTDGRWFSPIAHIPASGASATRVDYVHDDAPAPAGLLYYRLRQFDQDGAEHTGPVAAVLPGSDGPPMAAWGEAGAVRLDLGGGDARWRLLDSAGRTLAEGRATGTAGIVVPAGPSLLLVHDARAQHVLRIVSVNGHVAVTAVGTPQR